MTKNELEKELGTKLVVALEGVRNGIILKEGELTGKVIYPQLVLLNRKDNPTWVYMFIYNGKKYQYPLNDIVKSWYTMDGEKRLIDAIEGRYPFAEDYESKYYEALNSLNGVLGNEKNIEILKDAIVKAAQYDWENR